MAFDNKKAARLTRVAKMYYENNLTQNEIAQALKVSRPMVSKLLAEALDLGIVTITISESGGSSLEMAKRLRGQFGLKFAIVLPEVEDESQDTNLRIAKAGFDIVRQAAGQNLTLALGWGQMIAALSSIESKPTPTAFSRVIPLSGGSSRRHTFEHSNAFAFALADKLGATAYPIFLPAEISSEREYKLVKSLSLYSEINKHWDGIDAAVLELLESDIDSDSAVGQLNGHHYTIDGVFLKDEANAICASLPQIKNAKNVLLMAHSEADPRAILGALRTGLATHIALTETMAQNVLSFVNK